MYITSHVYLNSIYIYMCTDVVGRPLGVVSMWDLPILFCVPGVWDPKRIQQVWMYPWGSPEP